MYQGLAAAKLLEKLRCQIPLRRARRERRARRVAAAAALAPLARAGRAVPTLGAATARAAQDPSDPRAVRMKSMTDTAAGASASAAPSVDPMAGAPGRARTTRDGPPEPAKAETFADRASDSTRTCSGASAQHSTKFWCVVSVGKSAELAKDTSPVSAAAIAPITKCGAEAGAEPRRYKQSTSQ